MADDQSRIRRGRKQNRFTTIDNEPLEKDTLSWKAKGILTYLMSKPEDWEVKLWQLKQASKDGRDSTEAGLRELIEHGYIKRTRLKDAKGRFCGYDYVVSDIAIFDPEEQKNASTQNKTTNGFSEHGETVSGLPEHGETANGSPEYGETVNGKPAYNNTNYNQEGVLQNTDLQSVCDEPEHTHTPFLENSQTNTQDSPQASPKATQHHTFAQSPYSDFENFKNLLITLNFPQADADYYFKKISASCKSKGTKSKDFGAYIELWLTEDQAKNKLQIATTQQASKPAVKTTTDYNPTETITQKLENLTKAIFSGKANRKMCEAALEDLRRWWKEANAQEQQTINELAEKINELIETLPPNKTAQDQPPTNNQRKRRKKDEKLKDES